MRQSAANGVHGEHLAGLASIGKGPRRGERRGLWVVSGHAQGLGGFVGSAGHKANAARKERFRVHTSALAAPTASPAAERTRRAS